MRNVFNELKLGKKNTTLFMIGSIGIVGAIVCMIAYNLMGSHVAADGTLIEPFALIPFTWMFGFISIISFMALGVRRIIDNDR